MRKALSLLLVTVLVIVIPLVGCGQNQPGSGGGDFDGEIRMGAVMPLTGPTAEVGIAVEQGLRLAASEINQDGGVTMNGRSYEIVLFFEDDQGVPAESVSAAERLLNFHNVDFMFAGVLSSCALAVMEIAHHYPDIVFTTVETTSDLFGQLISADPERYFNFFKPCFNNEDYGQNAAQMLAYMRDRGIIDLPNGKIAYITEDTDAGRGFVEAHIIAMERYAGGSITVAHEIVPVGHTDFFATINRIRALNPDVVFTHFNALSSGVAYLQQSRELDVPWTDIGMIYPMRQEIIEQAGEAAEGLFWFPLLADFENCPYTRAFGDRVLAMFPGAGLNAQHLSAWNVMQIAVEAFETAGTTNARDGLAQAFRNVDF
ncbi:MAG: ABC transporter substrate-binding protein, partial [Treponema sp.]|nr:ABC transporter substrate-binding protein [Treponema sp.]